MIMFSSSNIKYSFMGYICTHWFYVIFFLSDHVPYLLIILAYKTNSANLYKYTQLLNRPWSLA